MKNKIWNYVFIVLGAFLLFLSSCTKVDNNDPITGGIIKDVDGNVYNTVKIGTQVWMVENLKTTKYRNGEPIPNVIGNDFWRTLTTGAYCWFDNNSVANKETYGALYNWFTVIDTRNIAPTGWHVPTYEEWIILIDYLGGINAAGGKLKERGTSHWSTPNTGATNISGFNAFPGGYQEGIGGGTSGIGLNGVWWSVSEGGQKYAWFVELDNERASVRIDFGTKTSCSSVRCIKDY